MIPPTHSRPCRDAHTLLWACALAIGVMLVSISISCSNAGANLDTANNEALMLWLARTPAVINPPLPPEERCYYKSFDEWKKAGLLIPHVERELMARVTFGSSVFRPEILIHALGEVGGDDGAARLCEILESPKLDKSIGLATLTALAHLRKPNAVAPLVSFARSTTDHGLRCDAIVTLGEIGDSAAKPAIEELLSTREFSEEERSYIVGNVLPKVSKKKDR
jgi:hypothetical protein